MATLFLAAVAGPVSIVIAVLHGSGSIFLVVSVLPWLVLAPFSCSPSFTG
jgi:hypothetical protein